MEYENILYTVENHTAVIALNRPDVLNAVNRAMGHEFLDALKQAKSSSEVRGLIVTGAGKAFCVGQDLKDMESPEDLTTVIPEIYNPILRELYYFPKPTLAVINGHAVGGGLGFALACDMRFAAEESVFSALFVRIGAVADSGTTYLLPRIVGWSKAFELLYTGKNVAAPEALEIGLVNKTAPKENLMTEAKTFMASLTCGPTKTLALDKQLLLASWHEGFDSQLELEGSAQNSAIATEDFKEGISAFVEKRKPIFLGK